MANSYVIGLWNCNHPLLSSMYIAPGHMVTASESISDIYIGILPPLMHVKQFWQLAYVWHLRGISVSGIYFAILWLINIAVY